MRDLTFADVCKFIKEDEASLIDTADSFLTLGLPLSPLVFGLPIARSCSKNLWRRRTMVLF